jgi:hypothetical protein
MALWQAKAATLTPHGQLVYSEGSALMKKEAT